MSIASFDHKDFMLLIFLTHSKCRMYAKNVIAYAVHNISQAKQSV